MTTDDVRYITLAELEAGLDDIRAAPKEVGTVRMIVRRPAVGARERLDTGELSVTDGLVGDSWNRRGGSSAGGGGPDRDTQLNVTTCRAMGLIAQDEARWPLAGDQLFVDMDLSRANLPPPTRLAVGSAVIVVTAQPHTGCQKFVSRFGLDATQFVNSTVGRSLNLRGINARVVQAGTVSVSDAVYRVDPVHPAIPLHTSVDRAIAALRAISEEASALRRRPEAWSPREVIGHLIDSASNNHQRFVRAQFSDDLVFPGYDQDAWVTAQRYQEAPWSELVSLWHGFNLQLVRVMDAVADDMRTRERHSHNLYEIASRGVPKSEPTTLDYFLHDYVDHLEHHLLQILGADFDAEWYPLCRSVQQWRSSRPSPIDGQGVCSILIS